MFKRLLMSGALFYALAAVAQTTQPILQPHATFVNAAGSPCSGCQLFSYAAGTTTPLATYTDASGGTPNTNPVILDVAGGAQVWLGSAAYKFVLEDSLSSTIWTVDNVNGFLSYCSKSGCTMTGALTVGGGLITANAGIAPTTLTASGQITANGGVSGTLTGAASLNVLKAGDTMTGPLQVNANNGALGVAGNGTYTGSQPLNHAAFLGDGINPATWWNFTNSLTNAESEVYSAMITPVGSTQTQTTALAGVNVNNSAMTNGVGVYGAGVCNTNGSHCWGGNFLVSDVTSTGANSLEWGIEADNNVYNSTTTGYAFNAIGFMTAQSSKMIAMEISRPVQGGACTNCAWTGGVQVEEGAVLAQPVSGAPPYGIGLILNPVIFGSSSQNSQLIGLVSRNSIGQLMHANIYLDPNGNWQWCMNNTFATTTVACSGVDNAGNINSAGAYEVTPTAGVSHVVIPGTATGYHGGAADQVQMSDGTGATGNCVMFAADHSVTDAGVTCGGGGGGGGSVTTFTAPGGSWPTWLVPTVTNATTTPSLAVAVPSQSANVFLASPNGSTGTMTPRAIVNADLPAALAPTSIKPTTYYTNAEYSLGTCTTAKTVDPVNGNKQKVTLTDTDVCALTFTQPGSGTATVQIKITQSAAGAFSGGISGCKWPGGVVPTITQTSGAVDMLTAYLDGTNSYCQIAQAFN